MIPFTVETSLGTMYAEITNEGISKLSTYPLDFDNSIQNEFTQNLYQQLVQQLTEYMQGKRKEFDLQLNAIGTGFQLKVWQQLQTISFGTTISYTQQATQLNAPKSIRAIAAANGKNPIMILIPCHRVIGADGSLTGYAGGLEMKERLLNLESGQQSLF